MTVKLISYEQRADISAWQLENSFHVMNHERVPIHDDRIKIWSQSEKRTRIGNSHQRARDVRSPVRRYVVWESSDLIPISYSSHESTIRFVQICFLCRFSFFFGSVRNWHCLFCFFLEERRGHWYPTFFRCKTLMLLCDFFFETLVFLCIFLFFDESGEEGSVRDCVFNNIFLGNFAFSAYHEGSWSDKSEDLQDGDPKRREHEVGIQKRSKRWEHEDGTVRTYFRSLSFKISLCRPLSGMSSRGIWLIWSVQTPPKYTFYVHYVILQWNPDFPYWFFPVFDRVSTEIWSSLNCETFPRWDCLLARIWDVVQFWGLITECFVTSVDIYGLWELTSSFRWFVISTL